MWGDQSKVELRESSKEEHSSPVFTPQPQLEVGLCHQQPWLGLPWLTAGSYRPTSTR